MQYSAKLVKQATGTGNNRSHSEANVHSSKGVMESSSIYRGGGYQSSYGAPATGLIRGACGASGRGFSRTRRNNICIIYVTYMKHICQIYETCMYSSYMVKKITFYKGLGKDSTFLAFF